MVPASELQAGGVFRVIGVAGELCQHLPVHDPPWTGLLEELRQDLLLLLLLRLLLLLVAGRRR
jgi:hypothetical protein